MIRHLPAFLIAVLLVGAISLCTNRQPIMWDTEDYEQIAENGITDNPHLRAPFGYRPLVPLIVGTISAATGVSINTVFFVGAHLAGVAIFLLLYALAIRQGADASTAFWISTVLVLYYPAIKWALSAGSAIDIYALALVIIAFGWAISRRYASCLLVCAVGLLAKEWLLLPLAMVAAANTVFCVRSQMYETAANRRWAVAAVIAGFFVLPRILIHVTGSAQEIDPTHPETLRRLLSNLIDPTRWATILLSYAAAWLPVLMLVTRDRLRWAWKIIDRRHLAAFMAAHLLLTMYGGTNVSVFVSYSLPVIAVVLVSMDRDVGRPGCIAPWERLVVLAAVILFNRVWDWVPTPDEGMETFVNYYTGSFYEITPRYWKRVVELIFYIGSASVLRNIPWTSNENKTQHHPKSYSL